MLKTGILGNSLSWTDITTSLDGVLANPYAVTCFYAYYLYSNGPTCCYENKKPFIGAVQSNRFESFCNCFSGLAYRNLELAGVYNDEMNELLIKYFDPNHDTPNYVLFNAFIKKKNEFKVEIDTEMRIPLLQ